MWMVAIVEDFKKTIIFCALEGFLCSESMLFWIIRKTLTVIEEQQIETCAWRFPGSSAGKESSCNARLWFDSWVGKIPWRRDRPLTPVFLGFPRSSDSKESACNVGDLSSIPGLGRSPGGEHGNPLQYSYLVNPPGQKNLAGYIVHGVAKSRIWLSNEAQHSTDVCSASEVLCCPSVRKERSRYSLFPLPSVQQGIVIPEKVLFFKGTIRLLSIPSVK